MKKSLIIGIAVAVLFMGSTQMSFAQTKISDSALLAQLFDMVTDLSKAIGAIIEKQITSISENVGSTQTTEITGTKTPAPAPQPVPKPSPEPGVFSFKVNSPVSGDKLALGKIYEVKWESDSPTMGATESPNFVSLYLVSTNNASKRPTILWTVAAFTRNTGSYKWTVSKNIYPGDYQLAVEPYARPDRRSYSGTFSVVSDIVYETDVPKKVVCNAEQIKQCKWMLCDACSIANGWPLCSSCRTPNSPIGGGDDVLQQGGCNAEEIKTCKFASCDECSKPKGAQWPICSSCRTSQNKIVGGQEGGDSMWCGRVCEVRGLGCPRMVGNACICACVISSQYNPIGGQQTELKIKITNPSDTTVAGWKKGSLQTIKWESTDPSASPLKDADFISIYLIGANDSVRVATISSKAYNDGDFRWTVSSKLAPGTYKVVIQSVANTSLKVMSSAFSVTE